MILKHLMSNDKNSLPKFPKGKTFSICHKCGKIYTSWISSLAHNHGQCHKVKDARENYDFTDRNK